MAKKRQQKVSVGFAVNRKGLKGVAEQGEKGLPDVGHVVIKSGTRFLSAGTGSGYETRLWEKVTCDVLGGLNPADILVDPKEFGIKVVSAKAEATKQRAAKAKLPYRK